MTLQIEKLKVLIADDEPMAIASIKALLATQDDMYIVAECEDGYATLKGIATCKPDVVFLDIQMPSLTGFQVLQQLPEDVRPVFIFVTAYDQYALRAFDAAACDYLLKPYDDKRFYQSLDKARAIVQGEKAKHTLGKLLNTITDTSPSQYAEKLLTKTGLKTTFIAVDDVYYIESEGNFVKVYLLDSYKLANYTMKQLESILDPSVFVRVHKSFLLNVKRVDSIQSSGHGDCQLILTNGESLKLSRNYRDALHKIKR